MSIIQTSETFFYPGGKTGCLLIHGFTGTPKEMHPLGTHLSIQGFTVLGVRLFAHATNPEDMLRARWQDWLNSVEDGWHFLSGFCDQIVLIGLSMGGVLSLLVASNKTPSAVIAIAAPHHLPDDPRLQYIRPISFYKPFIKKERSGWFDTEAQKNHISYDVYPTRAFIELKGVIQEMQKSLPLITTPTQLIYSSDDKTVRVEDEHMENIFDNISSSIKEKHLVSGSTHILPCDARREHVFNLIVNFIESVQTDKGK